MDEPLVWYEGTGTTDRRFLHHDRQGSVVAHSNSGGAIVAVYRYGPWGEVDTGSGSPGWGGSRFRYTGQIALPEAQLYHYKARAYDPAMGRFLQTDPAGFDAGLNMYGYVSGDPVGNIDSGGMAEMRWTSPNRVTVRQYYTVKDMPGSSKFTVTEKQITAELNAQTNARGSNGVHITFEVIEVASIGRHEPHASIVRNHKNGSESYRTQVDSGSMNIEADSKITRRTLAHEFLHTMGATDLYDVIYDSFTGEKTGLKHGTLARER